MTIDYKNISVYFTVSGKGEIVVLLHGFLETSEMWRDLVEMGSEDFRKAAPFSHAVATTKWPS